MEKNALTIYCLGGPLLSTEWSSIMGDKYRTHLNFEPVLVNSPEAAQIIVWDGMITPKSAPHVNQLLDTVSESTIFLITGEASTLLRDHPFVKLNSRNLSAVFLPPSRVLPEELMEALDECRKRLANV